MIFYVLTQSRHLESRQCEIWSVVAAGAVENRPNLTFPCLCRDFLFRGPRLVWSLNQIFSFYSFLMNHRVFQSLLDFRASQISSLLIINIFLERLMLIPKIAK